MPGQAQYLRVGLLIVAGLALGLGLIWFLGGDRIRGGVVAESYFSESVQGLDLGAPVKYRGVTLGRVTEIGLVSAEYDTGHPEQLDMRNYRLVFVRYLVDRSKIGRAPDTPIAVKLGLRARLASQGITGLSYIELDFVDPDRYPALQVPWHPNARYIPSMPSTLSQVQDAAQQLLAHLNKVDIDGLVAALTGLTQDLHRELTQGDLHRALTQITSLTGKLETTVDAADLPGLTADIRQTSAALRGLAEGQDVRRLLSGAQQAMDRLTQAMTRLPPLIASVQATSRRAGDSTADVQQALVPVLRDMQATMQNLRETTEVLRRYPSQVLSRPPPRTLEPAR